ncbi:hypothetical protein BDZ89DRAFT_1062096 [Hymenopellis radicata]|nr:hypothetical protein BDZ89DRAFT_1062096 [Hymenopellis radicata]
MESKRSPCGALPPRSIRVKSQDQTAIPFHHLSVSNLAPTDRVLFDIQTTILPALDQDILAVDSDAASESLERERDALTTIKQDYANIISTRRRIPPEIWSEIFLYGHFLDSGKSFDWPQVCQTWRNLALSLHSCWSAASERDVELLAFHLLDITLLNRNRNNDDLPFIRRMREMVFAESRRWRTAHIEVNSVLCSPLRGRLPQLELLDFKSVGALDSGIISAFKDCPRLVTVALIEADPRMFELPVKQITCLRLSDTVGPDYFRAYGDLISQCPLLGTLRVDLRAHARDPFLQSLTLPYLRDLKATHPNLLDYLTLPRLEVAALDWGFASGSSPNSGTLYSFYCLIQRSNCASNLTELRIMHTSLTLHRSEPHLLLSILSQTTKLATLQVDASIPCYPDKWSRTQIIDIMKALEVVPGHRVTFLPRLLSLDIKQADHDADCIAYLEPHDDFDGLSKLEKFRFSLCADYFVPRRVSENNFPMFNDHETSVLRGLTEDGMSLDIRFEWGTSLTCFRSMF